MIGSDLYLKHIKSQELTGFSGLRTNTPTPFYAVPRPTRLPRP